MFVFLLTVAHNYSEETFTIFITVAIFTSSGVKEWIKTYPATFINSVILMFGMVIYLTPNEQRTEIYIRTKDELYIAALMNAFIPFVTEIVLQIVLLKAP